MKPFIEMDPELCRKAIEGYDNVLEGEQQKLDAFYRQFTCPMCKSAMQKEIVAGHTFSDEKTLVPRSILKCTFCGHCMDPHSGITLQVGNAIQIPAEVK